MGCGSSKGDGGGGAKNDNPPIDGIDVPDLDPKYPAPKPPENTKDDIFKPADFTAIDNKAKQMARTNASSYDAVSRALTANCTTDLQKARAIFVWLFHQNIHGSFYSGVTDPHTPRGYMKLIKTGKGSYATFFALLCREANIPCNVIRGVSKGDNYEVGQQNVKGMDGAWNAVYLAGSWRFVHPLWAYYKEKQAYEFGQPPPAGTKRVSINEFYWLTDPMKMICFHNPKAEPWQLLKSKWDQKKFLDSPQFTEDYFKSGLMLPRKYNAIIYSDNGICIIDLDHQAFEDLRVDATVIKDVNQSQGENTSPDLNMGDYVTVASSSTRKSAIIRFPEKGRYNADVYGGKLTSETQRPLKIVEFRLECSESAREPVPFPLNPRDGFGILPAANQMGISDPNPDSGLVLVKQGQQKTFSFTTTQRLEAEATLVHYHNTDSRDFHSYISTRTTEDTLTVDVIVPDEKLLEFGLEIAARPEGGGRSFVTVANYLLVDENWKKRTAVVSPTRGASKSELERIRQALITATGKTDIAKLENAVEEFERNSMPDLGDLTRARQRLVELHLANLKKTTRDRKLEDLERAIDAAKKSHVADQLVDTKEMADAEAARRQLKRLKLYMHKVMELNKATISEIHSYQRPRPLVQKVMQATFRLLGEPNKKIQDWSHIQNSMRRLGRNSMISRMRRRDIVDIKEPQVNDAERYLGETNKILVRMCSAGAGTFYVWSNNMISEHQGKGTLDPTNIWGRTSKEDPYSRKSKGGSVQNSPRKEKLVESWNFKDSTPRGQHYHNDPGRYSPHNEENTNIKSRRNEGWGSNTQPSGKQQDTVSDDWDPNRRSGN
ncbi:hillarin [Aplysia californica]|uniref:Hillarin n=1 Tax=Aplysia californica TaxID=6500 RepID=A0ABM0K338_APLCA|nr:hillarin [Aplysia californica]